MVNRRQGGVLPTTNAVRVDSDLQDLSGPLARLVEYAPYKPYCSDNKTASLILPFAIARQYEYIQINQPTQVYWLIFDIDYPNPFAWEDADLPPPNIITSSPDTMKSHMCYAIEPVCTSRKGSEKAISYMKAVRAAYAKALNADTDYSSPVTKNPLHPSWKVWCPTEHVYSLGELADYKNIDLSVGNRNYYKKDDPFVGDLEDPQGRNCTLFLQLRLWAYSQVHDARKSVSSETWHKMVLAQGERLNRSLGRHYREGPLKFSEVKATAKSVANWTWTKYTGRAVDRGVMEMGSAQIPLVNKQRLAARRTHSVRKDKTLKRLLNAANVIHAAGKPLNRSSIARACSCSRQNVARYWTAIEALEERLESRKKCSERIQVVEKTLSDALDKHPNVISLAYVSRTTGIDRRKIKAAYPSLFDP